MRLSLPLLLGTLPLVQSQLPVGAEFRCRENAVMKWTDESWKQAKKNIEHNKMCLYYQTGYPGYDVSTCGSSCGEGVEASGCMATSTDGYPDPDGNCFYAGKCICPKDVEWVGDLLVVVVEALGKFFQDIVDAFVCSGILDAILLTVDIGLSLIPGGAFASTAMRTGIRIAKSVAEAGSDRSAFEQWFGAQCSKKAFDIDKVWDSWTGVPDSVIPSWPGGECLKSKGKKGCKKKPSEDDDKKEEEKRKKAFEEERESKKKTSTKATTKPKTTTVQKTSTKATSTPKTNAASSTSSKVSSTPKARTTKKTSTKAASASKATITQKSSTKAAATSTADATEKDDTTAITTSITNSTASSTSSFGLSATDLAKLRLIGGILQNA